MQHQISPSTARESKKTPTFPDHDLDKYVGIMADRSMVSSDFDRIHHWQEARKRLTGNDAEAPINMAYECTDRQTARFRGSKTALIWINLEGAIESFTFGALTAKSNAFAHVLAKIGVHASDSVFTLLGRRPELYISCLGTLKMEAIFCPLFAAFGPIPIKTRMHLGKAKVLITSGKLFAKKFSDSWEGLKTEIPTLESIIITQPEDLPDSLYAPLVSEHHLEMFGVRIYDFDHLMLDAPHLWENGHTKAQTPALIHFTSGTTGIPKGAVHVHDSIIAHFDTAQRALGLTEDDIYWCTADPGWVTGTSYGIFAPLSVGATMVVLESEFDPDLWYRTLEQCRVTVWYTAPTALRMLMKAGDEKPQSYDLSSVRHVASVGEPLNAEVIHWGKRVLGKEIHDTWWQTETGCIVIANPPGSVKKPGAMGQALPGMDATLLHTSRNPDGTRTWAQITTPGTEGELAVRLPWPSLFVAYLDLADRYRSSFVDGWYLTGDLVRQDTEGFFWFVGRQDDVIKSSGHLIGPFEIESVLLEHPGVAEAGVIGKPDPTLGEVIKAFISLKQGFTPSEGFQRSLLAHARKKLGPAVAPREISFMDSLPKTRSGKIMRRLLKARELGLPEGDTSTLETM